MKAPFLPLATAPALIGSALLASLPIPLAASFLTPLAAPAAAQDLPVLPIQFNPAQVVNRGRIGSVNGGCDAEGSNGALSAIAYTDTQTQAPLSALTSQAQPTLWFYVPAPINDDTKATFVLKNSLSAPLYERQLTGQTDRAGIIGIPLSTMLSVGAAYQWSLTFNCTDDEQTTLSGWIERGVIDSALGQTFDAVGDRNRAALYANYGFLQDALSELATLRRSDGENEAFTQDWTTFLGDLNLSSITTEPLLDCCQLVDEVIEDSAVEETEMMEESPSEAIEPETEGAEREESEEPESEKPEPEAQLEEPVGEPEEDSRTILQRARDRG